MELIQRVKTMPDGIRKLIYDYIAHPVSLLFNFKKNKYFLKYVLKNKTTAWNDIAPSIMGTNYYGNETIIRTNLSYGEQIRFFRKTLPQLPIYICRSIFLKNKDKSIECDKISYNNYTSFIYT